MGWEIRLWSTPMTEHHAAAIVSRGVIDDYDIPPVQRIPILG
ncbi:hypothetical protein [Parapedobacter tibetensis]|nr:hypothetical protein [Parapedobacter tibetensis]